MTCSQTRCARALALFEQGSGNAALRVRDGMGRVRTAVGRAQVRISLRGSGWIDLAYRAAAGRSRLPGGGTHWCKVASRPGSTWLRPSRLYSAAPRGRCRATRRHRRSDASASARRRTRRAARWTVSVHRPGRPRRSAAGRVSTCLGIASTGSAAGAGASVRRDGAHVRRHAPGSRRTSTTAASAARRSSLTTSCTSGPCAP